MTYKINSVQFIDMVDFYSYDLQVKYVYSGIPQMILPDAVAALKKICPDTSYTDSEIGDIFLYFFKQDGNSAPVLAHSLLMSAREVCSKEKASSNGTNNYVPAPTGTRQCADGTYVQITQLCPDDMTASKKESDNTMLYVGIGAAVFLLLLIMN